MTPAAAVLALAVAAGDFSPGSPDAPPTPAAAPAAEAPAPQDPGYAFRPKAAAAAFVGLALVDAATAGVSLALAASAGHGDLDAGIAFAALITGAGVWGIVYGPGLGAAFASRVDGRAPGPLPLVLAYACQAAAVGLTIAAIAESGNDRPGRAHALLAGAAAVHFVGIPLALGLAREPRGGAAPVARLALSF